MDSNALGPALTVQQLRDLLELKKPDSLVGFIVNGELAVVGVATVDSYAEYELESVEDQLFLRDIHHDDLSSDDDETMVVLGAE